MVKLYNPTDSYLHIKDSDAIVQGVITEYHTCDDEEEIVEKRTGDMGSTDKNKEAIINLKVILSEIIECEESICYVTDIDAEPLRLAIKALEKQIPKKPIVNDDLQIACPNCSATLIYCLHTSEIDYCDKCGQRLDWSEEYA